MLNKLENIPYLDRGRNEHGVDCIGLLCLSRKFPKELQDEFDKCLKAESYLPLLPIFFTKQTIPEHGDVIIAYFKEVVMYAGYYLEDGLLYRVDVNDGVVKDHIKHYKDFQYDFWRLNA
jgi:hypothetical protein